MPEDIMPTKCPYCGVALGPDVLRWRPYILKSAGGVELNFIEVYCGPCRHPISISPAIK